MFTDSNKYHLLFRACGRVSKNRQNRISQLMLFCNIISPFPESWRPIYSSHTNAFVIKAMWQKPCHMTFKVKVRKSSSFWMPHPRARYLPEPSARWWKAEDTRPERMCVGSSRQSQLGPAFRNISRHQTREDRSLRKMAVLSCLRLLPNPLRFPSWGPGIKEMQAILPGLVLDYSPIEFMSLVNDGLTWLSWGVHQTAMDSQEVSMALCPWCDGTQETQWGFVELGWNEIQAPGKTVSIPVRQPSIFRMRYANGWLTTCQ